MIYKRDAEQAVLRMAKFPVVAVLGPRQSGKTTLVKQLFKNHEFFSLEDPGLRQLVEADPKGFLQSHDNGHGIIFDEFHYIPDLLSYIQIEVDTKKRPGYFVLTGSHNFLMNQAISQSLAGRVGIVTLLPLCFNELLRNNLMPDNVNKVILDGSYPRLYDADFAPKDFYPAYIHSYVERDVRTILNVGDLGVFQKFLGLCKS